MSERTGGCLCGSVRYTLAADPPAVVVCHCRNCQKQAGSALSVVAVFARPALTLTGTTKVYEDRGTSGQAVYRTFCPACGSPVLTDTPQAKEQGIIFIKAGTLDDVSDLNPTAHYWTGSAQPWFTIPEGAAAFHRE
ncbi:GFA family protein [Iodidimonas sp. SYSU 1G8]|uniref:GFA family protein n=1 Tax=Iodidimonas sp. SYSU 1G8 TaxID=3133967 RepID=UPI0031FF08C8